MPAKSFEELEVWRKAHAVVLDVYRATRNFPREEMFGLTSQVRRSSASTPANIAEGFRRSTKADKARFYNMALASLDETRYHLLLAHDLGYVETGQLRTRIDEVARMLDSYTQAIITSDRSKRSTRMYGLGCLAAGGLSYFVWLLTSGF
jgi:four helix bundle protein